MLLRCDESVAGCWCVQLRESERLCAFCVFFHLRGIVWFNELRRVNVSAQNKGGHNIMCNVMLNTLMNHALDYTGHRTLFWKNERVCTTQWA